jgi:hypothetical protein
MQCPVEPVGAEIDGSVGWRERLRLRRRTVVSAVIFNDEAFLRH